MVAYNSSKNTHTQTHLGLRESVRDSKGTSIPINPVSIVIIL